MADEDRKEEEEYYDEEKEDNINDTSWASNQAKATDGWTSLGALRLASRSIKLLVDAFITSYHKSTVAGAIATGCYQLVEPFCERVLKHHFNVVPPLLPLCASEASVQYEFRVKSEVLEGALNARIQWSQLKETLNYVWREWAMSASKLDDLLPLLGISASSPSADGDDRKDETPLVDLAYARRHEDSLERAYGLGITCCLSIGLPNAPQERIEVWGCINQCHGYQQVFAQLVCKSDAWKRKLRIEGVHGEDELEDDQAFGSEDDRDTAFVTLIDSYRSSCNRYRPTIRYSVLRQLWKSLELPTETSSDGDGHSVEAWRGREVLVTLLACMGFVWKGDVELLWEPDDAESGPHEEDEADLHRERSYESLKKVSLQKRKEWIRMRPMLDDLQRFVMSQVTLQHDKVGFYGGAWKVLSLAANQHIAQQRFKRAPVILKEIYDRQEPWSQLRNPFQGKIQGIEAVRHCRALGACSFTSYGEDSQFKREWLEIECPVDPVSLHHLERSSGLHDEGHVGIANQPRLILRVCSSSSGEVCSTGHREQAHIKARIVNSHHGLPDLLGHLIENDANNEDGERQWRSINKRDDEVILCFVQNAYSSPSRPSYSTPNAIAAIGSLIGLSLASSNDSTSATSPSRRERGMARGQEKQLTTLAREVISFLCMMLSITILDAEESVYPAPLLYGGELEPQLVDVDWRTNIWDQVVVMSQLATATFLHTSL